MFYLFYWSPYHKSMQILFTKIQNLLHISWTEKTLNLPNKSWLWNAHTFPFCYFSFFCSKKNFSHDKKFLSATICAMRWAFISFFCLFSGNRMVAIESNVRRAILTERWISSLKDFVRIGLIWWDNKKEKFTENCISFLFNARKVWSLKFQLRVWDK